MSWSCMWQQTIQLEAKAGSTLTRVLPNLVVK